MRTSLRGSAAAVRDQHRPVATHPPPGASLLRPPAKNAPTPSCRDAAALTVQPTSESLPADVAAALVQLAAVIEQRDPEIEAHCRRVTGYATAFALHLGLSDADMVALERAAVLHDLGLAVVPEATLHKQERLTDTEWSAIRQHPVVAAELCGQIPVLAAVVPIVRSHHERLNGCGYPDGLSGDEVPYLAQVLGIVDAYDALTTNNPHRPAVSDIEAIRELRREVQRGWRRADLFEAFAALLSVHEADAFPCQHDDQSYPAYVRATIAYAVGSPEACCRPPFRSQWC